MPGEVENYYRRAHVEGAVAETSGPCFPYYRLHAAFGSKCSTEAGFEILRLGKDHRLQIGTFGANKSDCVRIEKRSTLLESELVRT